MAEGATVRLDGALSSDPENEDLSYAWSAPEGVTLSDASSVTPSFTAPEQLAVDQQLAFSLVVSDARNVASESATVAITVSADFNDVPCANAGPDQTVAEGATVTLDGRGSSDPGEVLSYSWFSRSDVELDDQLSATPSFTAPEQLLRNRTLSFFLGVTDARGKSGGSDTVIITIMANNEPPVANAGDDQTVAEGARVTLNGAGSSEPENEHFSFAWSAPEKFRGHNT